MKQRYEINLDMFGPLTRRDAIREQLSDIAFTAIGAFGDFGDYDLDEACPCLIDGPILREKIDAYWYLVRADLWPDDEGGAA